MLLTDPHRGLSIFPRARRCHLKATDEEGRELSEKKLQVLLAFWRCVRRAGWSFRQRRRRFWKAWADLLGRCFRQGRDGKRADTLAKVQRHLRDGVFGALASRSIFGDRETLASWSDRFPDFIPV
jgi:hypothetical protein